MTSDESSQETRSFLSRTHEAKGVYDGTGRWTLQLAITGALENKHPSKNTAFDHRSKDSQGKIYARHSVVNAIMIYRLHYRGLHGYRYSRQPFINHVHTSVHLRLTPRPFVSAGIHTNAITPCLVHLWC